MDNKKQQLHHQILQSVYLEFPDKDIYVIPEHSGRKVRELHSILWDLVDVHTAFSELLNLKQMNMGKEITLVSLWKSAIITYARCFTGSEDGCKTKLEAKECFKGAEHLVPLHTSLMEIRHGYVAHRGNNEFEEIVLVMIVDKLQPKEVNYITRSLRAGTTLFPKLLEQLKLIEYLKQHVQQRIDKQLRKLENYIGKIANVGR
jgi:hypothetical protein